MINLPNRNDIKKIADDWLAKGVAYTLICVKCSTGDKHVRLEYLYNAKGNPVGYKCPGCKSEWLWKN